MPEYQAIIIWDNWQQGWHALITGTKTPPIFSRIRTTPWRTPFRPSYHKVSVFLDYGAQRTMDSLKRKFIGLMDIPSRTNTVLEQHFPHSVYQSFPHNWMYIPGKTGSPVLSTNQHTSSPTSQTPTTPSLAWSLTPFSGMSSLGPLTVMQHPSPTSTPSISYTTAPSTTYGESKLVPSTPGNALGLALGVDPVHDSANESTVLHGPGEFHRSTVAPLGDVPLFIHETAHVITTNSDLSVESTTQSKTHNPDVVILDVNTFGSESDGGVKIGFQIPEVPSEHNVNASQSSVHAHSHEGRPSEFESLSTSTIAPGDVSENLPSETSPPTTSATTLPNEDMTDAFVQTTYHDVTKRTLLSEFIHSRETATSASDLDIDLDEFSTDSTHETSQSVLMGKTTVKTVFGEFAEMTSGTLNIHKTKGEDNLDDVFDFELNDNFIHKVNTGALNHRGETDMSESNTISTLSIDHVTSKAPILGGRVPSKDADETIITFPENNTPNTHRVDMETLWVYPAHVPIDTTVLHQGTEDELTSVSSLPALEENIALIDETQTSGTYLSSTPRDLNHDETNSTLQSSTATQSEKTLAMETITVYPDLSMGDRVTHEFGVKNHLEHTTEIFSPTFPSAEFTEYKDEIMDTVKIELSITGDSVGRSTASSIVHLSSQRDFTTATDLLGNRGVWQYTVPVVHTESSNAYLEVDATTVSPESTQGGNYGFDSFYQSSTAASLIERAESYDYTTSNQQRNSDEGIVYSHTTEYISPPKREVTSIGQEKTYRSDDNIYHTSAMITTDTNSQSVRDIYSTTEENLFTSPVLSTAYNVALGGKLHSSQLEDKSSAPVTVISETHYPTSTEDINRGILFSTREDATSERATLDLGMNHITRHENPPSHETTAHGEPQATGSLTTWSSDEQITEDGSSGTVMDRMAEFVPQTTENQNDEISQHLFTIVGDSTETYAHASESELQTSFSSAAATTLIPNRKHSQSKHSFENVVHSDILESVTSSEELVTTSGVATDLPNENEKTPKLHKTISDYLSTQPASTVQPLFPESFTTLDVFSQEDNTVNDTATNSTERSTEIIHENSFIDSTTEERVIKIFQSDEREKNHNLKEDIDWSLIPVDLTQADVTNKPTAITTNSPGRASQTSYIREETNDKIEMTSAPDGSFEHSAFSTNWGKHASALHSTVYSHDLLFTNIDSMSTVQLDAGTTVPPYRTSRLPNEHPHDRPINEEYILGNMGSTLHSYSSDSEVSTKSSLAFTDEYGDAYAEDLVVNHHKTTPQSVTADTYETTLYLSSRRPLEASDSASKDGGISRTENGVIDTTTTSNQSSDQEFSYYDGMAFEDPNFPDVDFGKNLDRPRDVEYSNGEDYREEETFKAATKSPPIRDTKRLDIQSLVSAVWKPEKTERGQHRSDIPIEDDDPTSLGLDIFEGRGNLMDESNGGNPASRGDEYPFLKPDTFEARMLTRMMPLVVKHIRQETISEQDLAKLSKIFGPLWPEIVKFSKDTGRRRSKRSPDGKGVRLRPRFRRYQYRLRPRLKPFIRWRRSYRPRGSTLRPRWRSQYQNFRRRKHSPISHIKSNAPITIIQHHRAQHLTSPSTAKTNRRAKPKQKQAIKKDPTMSGDDKMVSKWRDTGSSHRHRMKRHKAHTLRSTVQADTRGTARQISGVNLIKKSVTYGDEPNTVLSQFPSTGTPRNLRSVATDTMDSGQEDYEDYEDYAADDGEYYETDADEKDADIEDELPSADTSVSESMRIRDGSDPSVMELYNRAMEGLVAGDDPREEDYRDEEYEEVLLDEEYEYY